MNQQCVANIPRREQIFEENKASDDYNEHSFDAFIEWLKPSFKDFKEEDEDGKIDNLLMHCTTPGHIFFAHYNINSKSLHVLNYGSTGYVTTNKTDSDDPNVIACRIAKILRHFFDIPEEIKIYVYADTFGIKRMTSDLLDSIEDGTHAKNVRDIRRLSQPKNIRISYRIIHPQMVGNCWEICLYHTEAFLERPCIYIESKANSFTTHEAVQHPAIAYCELFLDDTYEASRELLDLRFGKVTMDFPSNLRRHRRLWRRVFDASVPPKASVDTGMTETSEGAEYPDDLGLDSRQIAVLLEIGLRVRKNWIQQNSPPAGSVRRVSFDRLLASIRVRLKTRRTSKEQSIELRDAANADHTRSNCALVPVFGTPECEKLSEWTFNTVHYRNTMYRHVVRFAYKEHPDINNFYDSILVVSTQLAHIRGYVVFAKFKNRDDASSFLFLNDAPRNNFDRFFMEHDSRIVVHLVKDSDMTLSLSPILQPGFSEIRTDHAYELSINFEDGVPALKSMKKQYPLASQTLTEDPVIEPTSSMELEEPTFEVKGSEDRLSEHNHIRINLTGACDQALFVFVKYRFRSAMWELLAVPRISSGSTYNPFVSFPFYDANHAESVYQLFILTRENQTVHVNLPVLTEDHKVQRHPLPHVGALYEVRIQSLRVDWNPASLSVEEITALFELTQSEGYTVRSHMEN
ncbi:hypothetical protein CYMTET_41719 [Cymbomonas tetramitiformis]|uniref:Uncharacterized protein n=1 Tax=Cymbomonas tetramitiformis TaxID=36881 RepID=A0AAE0C6Y6_9CHLO|nr:hypothetical protein CYMTET_41719 [Cymbomonas tetramitiformis]